MGRLFKKTVKTSSKSIRAKNNGFPPERLCGRDAAGPGPLPKRPVLAVRPRGHDLLFSFA
jgi:hypothetical protein